MSIPGNWLATDENGASLIPDGTEKNYKASRKCLEAYQVLKTSDKGATWSDVTATYKASLEGAGNSFQASLAENEVVMIFYRTSANPFELADNSSFLCGDSVAAVNKTGVAGSNLIDKVGTSTAWPVYKRQGINNLPIRPLNTDYVLDGRGDWGDLSHESLNLGWRSGDTASVKLMGYLSQSNGVLYFQAIYKELKHNGTQWGDDNKFDIVNKQSTVTDLNGETVIVGQKRVSLPYQFNDGEQY